MAIGSEKGVKNAQLSSAAEHEWNVVFPANRFWGLVQRYGDGYEWS